MLDERLVCALKKIRGISVKENEPLKARTTFKIGGTASLLIETGSVSALKKALKLCKKYRTGVLVLGAGSNLLINDGGIKNHVVISTLKLTAMKKIGKQEVYLGAGVRLGAAAMFCAKENLAGLEFSIGIPGSVGGAVCMNAGAFSGEMGNLVKKVSFIENGRLKTLPAKKLFFNYRYSIFKNLKNCVIIGVSLRLTEGEQSAIKAKTDGYITRRLRTQNVGFPSAGSVFKRKGEFYPAKAIDTLGLKGLSLGGAQVSKVHAGFIVNIGNAAFCDCITLISKVKTLVQDSLGESMETEIEIWGEGL